MPYCQLTKTPVGVGHSGFKFLAAFLKACANGGMVPTDPRGRTMVQRGLYMGVDGSRSDVQAHVRHVTVKVEEHKGKLEEAQAQEMEIFQEERRE